MHRTFTDSNQNASNGVHDNRDGDDYDDDDVTHKSSRKLPLLVRTFLIPVTAVSILALVVMRNEMAMVLRSNSDPVRTIDNTDDRDAENGNPVPTNWTHLHLQEKEKTTKDLEALKRKMESRFISLKENDEILTYQQLEEQFRPLLHERGLIMMGDSTTRLLFGSLWCLMEGVFRTKAGKDDDLVCWARLQALKKKCAASMANGEQCELKATLTNATIPLHLEFQNKWEIGRMPIPLRRIMRDNRDRFIFYMLPCLHALWMPGGREASVHSEYPKWNTTFQDFYSCMKQANPAHTFFVATSVTLCESKLWEKPLVDMYLQGKNFVNGEPSDILQLYEYQGGTQNPASLPANYSGPIPVISSFRQNHACDNSLFDEAGNLKCTAVGLEVLMQHSLMNNPAIKVLDMRGATEFGCDDTDDGRHYSRGLTLRREMTLLLRAMQSTPNSIAVKAMNSVVDRVTENGEPAQMNWTELHLQEKEKTQTGLVALKRMLDSRLISLKKDDEILSYQQLEEQYRPLLQERGLLMMGDSTSRILFGNLWCLMEGIFRTEGGEGRGVCEARFNELKKRCTALMAYGKQCDFIATFTNETTPFHLQFQRNWDIGKMDGSLLRIMSDNRDRFIFYMIPCLHALWMPGGRETDIYTEYPKWNTTFQEFYSSMERAEPAHTLFLATPVTMCESKLWEKPLVDAYLQGKSFVNGEPRSILQLYEYLGRTTLPSNYSGPIPVMKSFRENHTCDNALFDEAGNLKCTAVGLDVLMQHSLMNNPAVKVLDMHGATEFGCNDTDDGRHYSRGLTLRRGLTLLLRAMQSTSNSKAVRTIDGVVDRVTEYVEAAPINWTAVHLQEKEATQTDLEALKRQLDSRFISLKEDDEILSYQKLEEQYRPLLQERGLLMMGDSTSRILFGSLWCLIEGVFRSEGGEDTGVCAARLKELKTRCEVLMANGEQCDLIATFTNETTPFHLQFQRNWDIGKMDGSLLRIMSDNRDRFIFYMIPCLHALWMPGGRETDVHTEYPKWNATFQEFYSSMERAEPAHTLFLATPVTMCESKLWEKPLVDAYLQGKSFVNGEPRSILQLYEYQGRTTLPPNFSGPIPVMKSFRENHTCDNALFDEAGNLKCMAVGLEVLVQHNLMNNPAVKVLDIHGATEFGCDDTKDGRHYSRGLTLRRGLTLLLRAMQSAP